VPDLTGATAEEAAAALLEQGLFLERSGTVTPAAVVTVQSVPAGST
jgi:beta-lactam-binding protein with PASTA domain